MDSCGGCFFPSHAPCFPLRRRTINIQNTGLLPSSVYSPLIPHRIMSPKSKRNCSPSLPTKMLLFKHTGISRRFVNWCVQSFFPVRISLKKYCEKTFLVEKSQGFPFPLFFWFQVTPPVSKLSEEKQREKKSKVEEISFSGEISSCPIIFHFFFRQTDRPFSLGSNDAWRKYGSYHSWRKEETKGETIHGCLPLAYQVTHMHTSFSQTFSGGNRKKRKRERQTNGVSEEQG